MGGCQNYGPFFGPCYNTGPNTGPSLGDQKRDHNFDNPPCSVVEEQPEKGSNMETGATCGVLGFQLRVM